jgi:hypothetical protein
MILSPTHVRGDSAFPQAARCTLLRPFLKRIPIGRIVFRFTRGLRFGRSATSTMGARRAFPRVRALSFRVLR